MSLTKLTVVALFSVAALACAKDSKDSEQAPAEQTANVAAKPAAAEATPTAAAAQPAAEPGHECSPEHQKEAGCAGMAEEEGKGCNQWDEAATEVTRRDVPENAVWASFEVDGMTCGGCERRIQAKVGEIEGVVAVEASAELGKVRVAVLPDATQSQELAKTRIAELGYEVR